MEDVYDQDDVFDEGKEEEEGNVGGLELLFED